ncbi:hypothetical protein K466DRAFT_35297 [Polyporus arcularius HHB13444]|uniref:Uncharacterized protein n=1 Tax=Polyporus arcularius HHB13444 TaxID=1314778 RepID=A0A5C3PVV2_9APHY|nr:hypothetical protein K466DRAFT_35297 [Polyporus arcularius HHB13444]
MILARLHVAISRCATNGPSRNFRMMPHSGPEGQEGTRDAMHYIASRPLQLPVRKERHAPTRPLDSAYPRAAPMHSTSVLARGQRAMAINDASGQYSSVPLPLSARKCRTASQRRVSGVVACHCDTHHEPGISSLTGMGGSLIISLHVSRRSLRSLPWKLVCFFQRAATRHLRPGHLGSPNWTPK